MLALPGGIVTSTLTFTAAGTYTFTVYATDADGATTTSTVTVVVQQTLTAISVQTPSPPPLSGGSDFFQTGGTDQFGNPMSPGGATYKVTSGTVSASTNPPGVRFTAPPGITAPETDTITMTDGTFTKTITVSVTPPAGNQGQWTSPAPGFTANVTVTKDDPIQGTSSQTLTAPSGEEGVTLSANQSGSVSVSGSVSFTFVWQSAQNSPPPSVSYFAVSASGGGTYYDFTGLGGSGSPSGDDGLGDAEQDTSGADGTAGQESSAYSSGTRLYKESASPVNLSASGFSGTCSGSVGTDESGLVQVGYGAGAGPVPAPSVAVVSPGSGSVIQVGGDVTATVKVDLSVNGNASNALSSLSLKVQGGTGGGGGDLTPDVDGYASLDLGTLSAGTYTLTAVAKYDNGDTPLEVDSTPVTFTVASFTVKTNSWSPNPAAVSQVISGQVQGVFDPASVDGGGGGPTFVVYNWTTAGVWYSQSGTAGSFEPYGGNGIVEWQQGTADTSFHAQFFAPGQYLLEVLCTASVYSQSTGYPVASFTGTGYIGNQSDIDTSGGGTGHARSVYARVAHAGQGGGDIPVLVPQFEVDINDTPQTSDDLVGVGETTPCEIKLTSGGPASADISLTLTAVTKPGGGNVTITPSRVTIAKGTSTAAFTISGAAGSSALNDVTIHVVGGTAPQDMPVTVYHFDNPIMQVTCPKSAGDGYPVPLKVAATQYASSSVAANLLASVDLNPPGVNTSAPQIQNLSFGVVQNGSVRTTTVGVRSPTLTWTHEPSTGRNFSISVSDSITDTQTIPGGSDAITDAAPGWFSSPVTISAHRTVNTKDNPSADMRERVANVPISDTAGNQVGNIRYSVFAAISTSFKDWCCIYHSDTGQMEPLASCDWTLDVNSTDPNKRYGSDTQFTFPGMLTFKLPTCNDQLSDRKTYPYVETLGASDKYTWPNLTPQ